MKNISSKLFIPFALLVFVVISVLVFWIKSGLNPVSKENTETIKFTINRGLSASQIANKLEDQGIVKGAFIFKFYIQLTGNASKIQAGQYSLSPSLSLPEIVKKFLAGPDLIWVTIPEGLKVDQVSIKIEEGLDAKDRKFASEFMSLARGYEGYLFPDTYLIARETTPIIIFNLMRDTFDEKLASVENLSGLTSREVVVLASLIERETKASSEKPLVAGVIINRLNADWPLQIDASVQYAIAQENCEDNIYCEDYWPVIAKNDLEISSPYNTYKYTGLPPSPIANPGLDSLKAAANPKESDYWFYLHDSKGEIHFAKTLEEHNQNVKTYLGK